MKKYLVEVIYTENRSFEIEAETEEDACERAVYDFSESELIGIRILTNEVVNWKTQETEHEKRNENEKDQKEA